MSSYINGIYEEAVIWLFSDFMMEPFKAALSSQSSANEDNNAHRK